MEGKSWSQIPGSGAGHQLRQAVLLGKEKFQKQTKDPRNSKTLTFKERTKCLCVMDKHMKHVSVNDISMHAQKTMAF